MEFLGIFLGKSLSSIIWSELLLFVQLPRASAIVCTEIQETIDGVRDENDIKKTI